MSVDRDGFMMPEQSHIWSGESSATSSDRRPGPPGFKFGKKLVEWAGLWYHMG